MATRMKFKKELRKLHRETCIPLGKERPYKGKGCKMEKWTPSKVERMQNNAKTI